MDKLVVAAVSKVTEADLLAAERGARSARLDLSSRLAVLAVASLDLNFDGLRRDRIGICLTTRAGSLSTDLDYWKGRDVSGGLSPTLFACTLPSAPIGEIAIRYGLTGPNLCLVGGEAMVASEAGDLIHRGAADGCLCIACNIISVPAAQMIQSGPAAEAYALFLTRGREGLLVLEENGRDMESLYAIASARKSARNLNHERIVKRTES